MEKINDQIKDKIKDLNLLLGDKYRAVFSMGKDELRDFIRREVGEIKNIQKLDRSQLEAYSQKGGIVGVDGSKNRMGGAHPHFIEIYQGLAKSTKYKDDPLYLADIYTPLYEDQDPEDERSLLEEENEEISQEKRNKKLAEIEVEVALEGIKKFNPYVLMMDGSLIRYYIYAYDKWMELRRECEEREIILVGVIKDIKTSTIGDMLVQRESEVKESFYDRELLFGVLDYKDLIIIKDRASKKASIGYSSAFLRSSFAPTVVGMDIIDSQKDYLEEMARLVLTLAPENGRGVPLWIDIVDSEVKISDKMIRGLLEKYVDKDIYEKFFVSEREKRN